MLAPLNDVPLWLGMLLVGLLFVGLAWAAILLIRPWVAKQAPLLGDWDRVLGYAVAVYGVLYGVTLGMIAAGAWANFVEVDGIVLEEASSVAVLYRDAAGLPPEVADEVHALLTEYTRQVIDEEWPAQARGERPEQTVEEMDAIQQVLFRYEPETQAQITMQAQSVTAFNELISDRRARIAVTELALPAVLWVVLGVGAGVAIILFALIEVRSLKIHLVMAGLVAMFVGLVIYAIASFDHPYSGATAVTPVYFQTLLDDILSFPDS